MLQQQQQQPPHVQRCSLAALEATWRIEMNCAFPGSTATRCCSCSNSLSKVQYIIVCVQDWFHQHKPSVAPHFRPYVPDTLPTQWYKEFERSGTEDSMWSMWFIYYMHIEQLYIIFSNLNVYTGGKENCLCINRREIGLHNSGKGREDLCRLMTVWKDDYVVFPNNTVRLHWDGSPMRNRLY